MEYIQYVFTLNNLHTLFHRESLCSFFFFKAINKEITRFAFMVFLGHSVRLWKTVSSSRQVASEGRKQTDEMLKEGKQHEVKQSRLEPVALAVYNFDLVECENLSKDSLKEKASRSTFFYFS